MTDGSPFGDQADTVELLWGARPRPGRGPKPAMSVERIAQAAVEIADTHGLGAVSMQRVAGQLGFTKMALYRYLPGKAELVALMIDTATGAPPVLDESGDWRARLEDWARRMLATFRRHPWLLDATVGVRIMGPNELGWMECALTVLDGTGLQGGERIDTVAVVVGHIRMIAQQAGATEHPEQAMGGALAALMRTHGDRYPAFTAALTSAMAGSGQDNALDFGLQRILDGLEALIARRA